MHAASTQRCALAVAEPTGDASKQRRALAAAEAPKRWCPAGANPIVTYQNRTGHDLPSFPATIKGCSDQIFQIGVRSGSNINMVSESAADEFGLDVVIDDFGYDDYLDPDQSLPIRQSSIIGLTCFSLIHRHIAHDNQVDLWFDGFVVCDDVMDSIGVDIMVGAPFMELNDVSIRPRRHQIMFGDECVFSYDVGGMHMNTSAQEKLRLRACVYEREYKTSLCDSSETECEHEHDDMEYRAIESEDSTDNQSPFCVESPCEIETEDVCIQSCVFTGEFKGDESAHTDTASDPFDMMYVDDCLGYDQSVQSDLDTPVPDWASSISLNVCVGYDVDGRYATPLIDHNSDSPATEHSSSPPCSEHDVCLPVDVDGRYATPLIEHNSDSPATEHSSSPPCSEHDVCLPVITKVADHSSSRSVSEIESSQVPSLTTQSRHGRDTPTTEPSSGTLTTEPSSGTPTATTEPCSVTVVNVIADVPQVMFGINSNSPCVLTNNPNDIASSGKNSPCGPGSSTTLPPSMPVGLPQPEDGVSFPRNQRTTYSALLHRPTSHSSDACLHQPPPVWTNWPTADCDPLSAMVEYRPHSNVNHPNDCAALPRLASGHMIVCDVDDPPQATLADDDVPCLHPPSTDVGRHASPTWKSPPWTDGRLPPASSMERGPSPRPHDGAMSAFAHVMATKRVSPAPARGIAPLGSFDVSHPFGVPWTLPPAPPDVGLTAVPHGHNPPESPFTPG